MWRYVLLLIMMTPDARLAELAFGRSYGHHSGLRISCQAIHSTALLSARSCADYNSPWIANPQDKLYEMMNTCKACKAQLLRSAKREASRRLQGSNSSTACSSLLPSLYLMALTSAWTMPDTMLREEVTGHHVPQRHSAAQAKRFPRICLHYRDLGASTASL
jgi:hypothetical protein